jgi:hypothetical protein
MTDTPKDIHLAIWELLTPEEQKATGLEYVKRGWDRPLWYCHDIITHIVAAHRAIVDAAREVLDLADMGVGMPRKDKDINGWWFHTPDHIDEQEYPTRTEAIYHAIKWLRGQKQ